MSSYTSNEKDKGILRIDVDIRKPQKNSERIYTYLTPDLAAAFRLKCQQENLSQGSALRELIRAFVNAGQQEA